MVFRNFGLPAPFPGPPLPLRFPIKNPALEAGGQGAPDLDKDFIKRLTTEGFNSEVIKMGLKVANTYSQSRKKALSLGEKYVREMSK